MTYVAVESGSRGNLVTVVRSSQGGTYSGRHVVRSRRSQLCFAIDVLASKSSEALSIQCNPGSPDHRREAAACFQQLLQQFARAQSDQQTV